MKNLDLMNSLILMIRILLFITYFIFVFYLFKKITQNFNQSSYKKYFLCGIITHLGESGTSGHFIAYCRNDINDKFTRYNDDMVTKVNVMKAMSTKISMNEKEKKTPYILIYHYM